MKKNIWQGKNGPLLIAEIGGNHEGSFKYAKKLLNLGKLSGVDVLKFQIYQGSTLVNRKISPERYNHFRKFELTKKQHLYLADMCKESGLKYLSSVWNKSDLKWIQKKMDFFKVGSGDLTAYDQIDALCRYKKPILLSTGLAKMNEIKNTIDFIKSRSNYYKNRQNIAIMQCTSCYPTKINEINLDVIKSFQKFGYEVGYSHHAKSFLPLEIAYVLGANIFEFHFTDTRKNKNFRDHKISLTSLRVKSLIKKIHLIRMIRGSSLKKPTYNEIKSKHIETFRRGIYLNRDLKKGTFIKKNHLVTLRPENGISAKNYFKILNKKLRRNIKKYEKFDFRDLI